MRVWTEQEVTTLLSMWPTATYLQIGNALHRSRHSVCDKAKWLRDKGLLEGTKNRQNAEQSVKPDQQDFDAVKMDYCRNHHIDIVQLNVRFGSDNRLAADLYRLAQAAKVIRLRPKEFQNPSGTLLSCAKRAPLGQGQEPAASGVWQVMDQF